MFIDLLTQEKLDIRQQSFSGTDLNTNTNKMGIVYSFEPNKLTDNQHTVSSIIDHNNTDICLIKHTEARSVECKSDNEVKYIKNNCISVEINTPDIIFSKPILVTQTSYKLQEEIKKIIVKLANIYSEFDTKMFVYEKNITSKYTRNSSYLDDYGFYEPPVYKEVLPKKILKDFRANVKFLKNDEKKLIQIQEAINNQILTLNLFPKSKAQYHKSQILKDIKEKKYSTQEVFDELSNTFMWVISEIYY